MYIKNVIHQTISIWIKFYAVFRNKFLCIKNELILYKALMRTKLVYSCPVWSTISRSNFNKLQLVQNKFLRVIENYRKFSLLIQMHKELIVE